MKLELSNDIEISKVGVLDRGVDFLDSDWHLCLYVKVPKFADFFGRFPGWLLAPIRLYVKMPIY